MSGLVPATRMLWWREVVRFVRQPSRVVGAIMTPLIFWLFLGSGIGDSYQPQEIAGGVSYLEYFFPGTVMLLVLFTAIFSTITIIQDRKEGFLQGMLASPAPRLAIVLGKLLGGTSLALVQGLLLLALAPAMGLAVAPAGIPTYLFALALASFGLTGIGFLFAWNMESIQGFHVVMNLVFMPMWMLSGAFFPVQHAPPWLATVMNLNPLTYSLAAARLGFGGKAALLAGGYDLATCLAISAAFAIAMTLLAAGMVRRLPGQSA